MKCPVCEDVSLSISARDGVEIDFCPQCRGVWLDRGELDKILDRVAAVAPALDPPPRVDDRGRERRPDDRSRPDDRRDDDRSRDDDRRYDDRSRDDRRYDGRSRDDDRRYDRDDDRRYDKKRRKRSMLDDLFEVFD